VASAAKWQGCSISTAPRWCSPTWTATGLADFARELDASGERVATLRMNAADPADSAKAVQLAVERFGGIDFLVPSAGLYQSQPIRQMTDEQWRQTLGINLDGVFYLCQRAIPVLRANSAIVT